MASLNGKKRIFGVKEEAQEQNNDDNLLTLDKNLFPIVLVHQLTTHHRSQQLTKCQEQH